MNYSDFKYTVLAIASLIVGVIALVSEEYRLTLASFSALFLTAYFLSEFNRKIENNSERIKKLEEKLSIHQQLINIKADIKGLEKKVFRK